MPEPCVNRKEHWVTNTTGLTGPVWDKRGKRTPFAQPSTASAILYQVRMVQRPPPFSVLNQKIVRKLAILHRASNSYPYNLLHCSSGGSNTIYFEGAKNTADVNMTVPKLLGLEPQEMTLPASWAAGSEHAS